MRRTTPVLLAMAIALLAGAAAGQAQYVVPPGNSAVNQYTETLPTGGGGQDTEGKSRKSGRHSPSKVLGARNAHRLEEQGPQGQAAAETVAATAPSEVVPTEPAGGEPSETGGVGQKAHRAAGSQEGKASTHQPAGHPSNVNAGNGGAHPPAAEPTGSSGLDEVLAQATGSSSSGQMGLLLPLVIVGAIAWSLSFLWRQRRHVG